jgi:Fic family protein
MKNLLDFLATSKDHPIVTANVAFLQTMAIAPLGTKTAQFSFMLLFLFLYKYGYDLRSTITILPFWTHDLKTFQYTLVEAQTSGNFSKFIDFAIQQFAGELSEKRDTIPTSQLKFSATAALFTLTDRQKDILSRMDEPSVSVTNRAVQKQFGISQITASRDLARLSALGLLYPHGKGRSVYYTKV